MPPSPQRLYDLLLSCGFTPAELERITQQSMGTGLTAITTSDNAETQARDVVNYAEDYNLIRELTATVLAAGCDKPVLQNILLDDAMTLEDTKGNAQSTATALDLIRLENKVERMFDSMNSKLEAALSEMRHIRRDTPSTPVELSSRAIAVILVVLALLVVGQITLLAYVGTIPHG